MNYRRKVIWIALALLLGALAVRMVNCRRGILADEITTYWVSRLPESRIVEERLAHNHLPTYFLLMRQWLSLVGVSELTLRLPSIISGAVAVAALFLICARRFSLSVSLLAAALFGLNATHLFVSQWARMYALTTLLEVLLFGLLLSDLRRPSARRLLAYAAVVIAGCCLHLLFLQMAAIVCGLLLWERWLTARSRRQPIEEPSSRTATPSPAPATFTTRPDQPRSLTADLVRYLSPFALGAVLLLVWFNHAQTLNPGDAQIDTQLPWLDVQTSPIPLQAENLKPPRHQVADPSRVVLRVAFGDFSYWPFLQSGWPKYLMRSTLYALAALLLWAAFRAGPGMGAGVKDVGRVLADRSSSQDEGRALRFAVLWAVLPPLLMVVGAMTFAWVPAPAPRWLIGTGAAWALLFAFGVSRITSGTWPRRWAAGVLLSASVFIAWGALRNGGDGLREAFAYWRAHAGPKEKVFLAHRGYLEQAMQFEGITLPPESLRAGTVLDYYSGPDAVNKLVAFADGDSPIWILHYRFPPGTVLKEAFSLMSSSWRTELAFECRACSVYRLSRIPETR